MKKTSSSALCNPASNSSPGSWRQDWKSSTCIQDPIPTALLKSYIPILGPIIAQAVNLSIQTGYVPPALRAPVIRPLLKKPSLDTGVLANYRLISKLTFLSKVLEKVIASPLHDHLNENSLFEKFWSGFATAPRQPCSG